MFAIVAVLVQLPAAGQWNNVVSLWLQGPAEFPLTAVGFITDWLFSAQVVIGLATAVCLVFVVRGQWRMAASAGLLFPLVLLDAGLKLLIHQPPASTILHIRILLRSSAVSVPALEHGFPTDTRRERHS